ncbi:hypothetical protein P879_11180 [Paragonimus westermani]|uniref:Uncharacterized protein n=1 Tax=Paragonimus westermani TaxID=34504 RepID=A0A8T0DAK8_9TREM|nr:hypothetical protein P879_11180 [Paragonimus westermani]
MIIESYLNRYPLGKDGPRTSKCFIAFRIHFIQECKLHRRAPVQLSVHQFSYISLVIYSDQETATLKLFWKSLVSPSGRAINSHTCFRYNLTMLRACTTPLHSHGISIWQTLYITMSSPCCRTRNAFPLSRSK